MTPGAVAAALLRQGALIDGVSRLVTVAALVCLLLRLGSPPVLGATVLAGLAELYYAMRVGFDAVLFEAGDTDAALLELGLLPRSKAGRPIAAKLAGAKRLLISQAVAFLLQIACVFLGVWISGASPVAHQESQRFPKALPLAGPGRSPAFC